MGALWLTSQLEILQVFPHSKTMTHRVTLVNEKNGQSHTIEVGEGEFIFDVAAKFGIELSASCHAGVCVSCAAKVLTGEVDHQRPSLSPEELEAGFMLTCCASPKSDCTILVEQEEALLAAMPV